MRVEKSAELLKRRSKSDVTTILGTNAKPRGKEFRKLSQLIDFGRVPYPTRFRGSIDR